jgi:sphinganine-1-phosphate aldolase
MKENNMPNQIPQKGLRREDVMERLRAAKKDDLKWKDGKSFCLIYYPGDEKASMIQEAYNLYFTENALNPMSFPGLRKFETEVVTMMSNLLGGNSNTVGTMTSGGTESILMAVKAARDYARKHKPEIKHPEIVVPITAHPAFDKACYYFDVKLVHTPVDSACRADVTQMEKAINANTIMLVASAPSYPHGVLDPVKKISELAARKNLLCHVDACIGGMILPFMKLNGIAVDDFDFKLPGVTSMSADLHKYGYAAKGASVILYHHEDLRKFQFFVSTQWPGGIYGSASVAGSRPGGAIAAAWAALMGIGVEGYRELTRTTIETTKKITEGIKKIPELKLMAEPEMSIIAFDSPTINVFELADELNLMGWHFERLQNPPGLHLTVNYIHHTVVDDFLKDLRTAVSVVKKFKLKHLSQSIKVAAFKRLLKILPEGTIAKLQAQFSGKGPLQPSRTAAMYGMMGTLQGTDDLDQIVLELLNKLNKP